VAAIYDEIKKHKDRVEAIKLEMDNISQSRTGSKVGKRYGTAQ
jgi:hypothetical protein